MLPVAENDPKKTAIEPAAPHLPMSAEQPCKLRQSDAEYLTARRNIQLHTGSARIYVCRRCQANFTAGGGVPSKKMAGIGKCKACLSSPTVIARRSSS